MMKKMNKRGQAALEFLTTYGWAFLVILVMIGALGYFGVLNPDNFLPQRCNVGPEFNCVEYQAIAWGSGTIPSVNLSVILGNNVGDAMTVNNDSFEVFFGEVASDFCGVGSNISSSYNGTNATIPAGGRLFLTCTWNQAAQFPPTGNKVKIDIDGRYLPIGGQFNRPVSIEIFATLQDLS